MNQLYRAKVNDEGRLVIPAECRKHLGIVGGQEVILQVDETGLRLVIEELVLKQLQDKVASAIAPGVGLVQEFLRDRQQDAEYR